MQKIYAQKRKRKFKGYFWRATHDSNLAVMLILREWTQSPQYGFVQWEHMLFGVAFNIYMIFEEFQCRNLGLYSGSSEPSSFFFRWFTTSKLTRIFINFRVIHILLNLIFLYWIMLDQISPSWFDWNLEMASVFMRKTPWIKMEKLKAATNSL